MSTKRTEIREAAKDPCVACPWRTANQGKRTPDGWYSKANLLRLWRGLRTGEAPGMTCHPTDPDNPVSGAGRAAGLKAAPDGAVTRECAGSVILQRRELQLFNDVAEAGGTFADYRRGRSMAMTQEAMFAFASRLMILWPGQIPLRRDHNLNADVGVPGVLPWTKREAPQDSDGEAVGKREDQHG